MTLIIVVCESNLLMIFVQIFPKAITLTVRVKTADKCFLGLTLLQVPQIFRTYDSFSLSLVCCVLVFVILLEMF